MKSRRGLLAPILAVVALLGVFLLGYFIYLQANPNLAESLGKIPAQAGPGLGAGWCAPSQIIPQLVVQSAISQNESSVVTLNVTIGPAPTDPVSPTTTLQGTCDLSIKLLAPMFDITPVNADEKVTVPIGGVFTSNWLFVPKVLGTYVIAAVVNTCFVRTGVSVLNTFGLPAGWAQGLSLFGSGVAFLVSIVGPVFLTRLNPTRSEASSENKDGNTQKRRSSWAASLADRLEKVSGVGNS